MSQTDVKQVKTRIDAISRPIAKVDKKPITIYIMTRSAMSPYHPRITKKAFRAKAKQEGISFQAAAEARTKQLMGQKFPSTRRNPGRMDGLTWQGSSFICPQKIDGPTLGGWDTDSGYDTEYNDRPRTPDFRVSPGPRGRAVPVIHSLLDIARPAKGRGVGREFAMIRGLRGVIALEDNHDDDGSADDYELWSEDDLQQWLEEDEDDWEELYIEEHEKPRTYAAVLKEK